MCGELLLSLRCPGFCDFTLHPGARLVTSYNEEEADEETLGRSGLWVPKDADVKMDEKMDTTRGRVFFDFAMGIDT